MLIQEKALSHWINYFYGYGSWEARMWFIALEEGGGDTPEEVAEKSGYFYEAHASNAQPTLCDIREMYRHVRVNWDGPKANLFDNFCDFRFGKDAVLHGVWKNLIAFEHGYLHKDVPDLMEYQKYMFASSSLRNEALIRLYPLPSPHNHAWYYSWLDLPQLHFLKRRDLYQEHVYESRIRTILRNIDTYRPKVVLMYGMENITALKKSVKDVYVDATFKLAKAVKQQIPQYHRADLNGTTLIITTQIPALRHNRIETGFDWEVFGKSIVI